MVCMMAGSDYIKTSTGKEKTNATIPVRFVGKRAILYHKLSQIVGSLVMVRAIREYLQATGYKVSREIQA